MLSFTQARILKIHDFDAAYVGMELSKGPISQHKLGLVLYETMSMECRSDSFSGSGCPI